MSILDFIIKLITGQSLSERSEVFTQQLLERFQRILKSLIALFIGSILFCLLTGYLIDRTLTQLDQGSLAVTTSMGLLLILLLADLGVILWALRSVTKGGRRVTLAPPPGRSGDGVLETAIAALILNYVKEREATKKETATEVSPASSRDPAAE